MKRTSLTLVLFLVPITLLGVSFGFERGVAEETASVQPGSAEMTRTPAPPALRVESTLTREGSIVLDAPFCVVGQQLAFEAFGDPSWHRSAWAGIIPRDIAHGSESENDRHDLSYAYMEGRASARMTLPCPSQPGSYTVRLHNTDENGREVVSVSFEAKLDPNTRPDPVSQGALSLEKAWCFVGESLVFRAFGDPSWDRSAWAGVIPAAIEHGLEEINDQHDLSYAYMERRSEARMTLPCPRVPGAYTLRLHDSDQRGREVVSVVFEVRENPQHLHVKPHLALEMNGYTYVVEGQTIEVSVQIPDSFADDAWVGIIPADIPHGSERINDQHDTTYVYVKKGAKQTVTLPAPSIHGCYTVRLHDTDSDGREIKSVDLSVSEPGRFNVEPRPAVGCSTMKSP